MRVPLIALLSMTSVPAQTAIDDLRQAVRDAAESSRYATFLAGFLGLTGESELSGAQFTVDGDIDTDFATITYPLHRQLSLGEGGPLVRLEGDFGYAAARIAVDDVYGGQLPAVATSAKSRYEAFGGFVGAGPVLPIGDVSITPMALGGFAYVDNFTYYQGSGAGLGAAAFDGILFNWDATYAVYGGAVLLQHQELQIGPVHILPRLRYDVRRTDPLSTDDPSQDEAATFQWLVARLDLEGSTGWQVQGRDVRWTGELGYKRFLDQTGAVLGFHDYYEVGAGLRWDCTDVLPLLGEFGIGGSLLIGEDLSGWTIGMVAHF